MIFDWLNKYRFSFSFALIFHVLLFSTIFVNWEPEAEKSKKIVIKKGDVMKATTIPVQQYEDKILEIENKLKQKQEQKRKKREQEKAKKKAEKKRKEKIKKDKEVKRKKALAKKKKKEQEKRKKIAKEKAKKKKALEKKQALKKKKEQERKKAIEKEKELKKQLKQEQELKRKQDKKYKAEEKRRKTAEKKRHAEIAAEEARMEADRIQYEKGLVNRYAKLIENKISRYWRRPASVKDKMKCTLNIRMTEKGEVVSVKVIKSSGNYSFDRAAEKAVTGASPLPIPRDKKLFDKNFRNLTINYEK